MHPCMYPNMLAYADYSAQSHTWTLLQAAAYHLMPVRIARAYHHRGHWPPYDF